MRTKSIKTLAAIVGAMCCSVAILALVSPGTLTGRTGGSPSAQKNLAALGAETGGVVTGGSMGGSMVNPCDGVMCAPPADCQGPGVCDPNTGQCVYPTLPDGTACNGGCGVCRRGTCCPPRCGDGDDQGGKRCQCCSGDKCPAACPDPNDPGQQH
jgi:hypothetical protein